MTGKISPLEKTEKLEQLRFLYQQQKITIIPTEYESHGVDIPADIEKIEAILRGNHV
jgi:3-deoxy-manno-octulosonate cytidylyltransferase (CMP-KDO synthetase)